MTGRHQQHQSATRATSDTSPKPAPAPPTAPTPLAGLARAVAGETTDVMGGQAVPGEVAVAIRRRAGKGAALPGGVAEDFGAQLGTDLSRVRVHADSEADTIARSVQAKAFTLGHDIYFSSGTYSPGTRSGRSLLAHELTHVRQHQQGTHAGAGGLTVGRVDDPAEREAETVARQLDAGLAAAPAAVGGAGAAAGTAHRCVGSPTGTIRRLFGIFGASGVAQARDGEFSSDDEAIPSEFIDLVDAIQAVPELQAADDLKWDGSAYDDIEKTVGNTKEMAAIGGTVGVLGGLKEMYAGGTDVHEGRRLLGRGGTEYDFGTIDGQAVKAKDSASRNLGATKVEAGATALLGGGGGVASGVSSFMDLASTEIPFIDVAGNYYQAGVKGKKAIEDGVAAHRLHGQKAHIKREQDKYLPIELRAKRFGQFATAWATQKGLKSDDKKRWPLFLKKWQDSRPATSATATSATATSGTATSGTATSGTAAGTAAFDPLSAPWATFDSAPDKEVMTEFLEFLGKNEEKDFGYGTELRNEYERSLTSAASGKTTRTREGSADYEQMRDLGKVASFGHRRKAESASINAVEATGHALDATGTFTAAGDMGATKITGKALKAGSALYKGAKSLVKRAKDVHELRTAKNEMEYGGEKDRGVLWGAQQFFVGKLDDQAKKAKGALKAGSGLLQQHAVAKAAHAAYLTARQQWRDDMVAAVATMTAEMPGLPAKVAESNFKLAHPEPAAVPDPGPVPTTATAAGATKSAKALTAEQAKPLIKKLTKQCKRKVDDLLACLLSTNETVRNRARTILHILAETNLAGSLAKIDDADLDVLYKVHTKMKADTTYAEQHKVEFKKRKSAIKEILTSQLKGIGD